MTTDELLAGLPGEDLVRRGLKDFSAGQKTIWSCLVCIAQPRLHRAGLMPAEVPAWMAETELQLYRILCQEPGDAYSRYNSLLRELVSFENALSHRLTRLGRF